MAQLSSFVDKTNVSATKPTLKLIANLLSHDSFVLDIETCKPSAKSRAALPQKYRDVIPQLFWGKYNSEVCAFKEIVRLITKLKESQIYDNTLFVIVSDHGRADSYKQIKAKNIVFRETLVILYFL